MDGADDAIGDGDRQPQQEQQQQHQETNIASNLTSMTSNNGNEVIQTDSQAVDDFDADSKWEITPLEKASYDCGDMYNDQASPEQQSLAQAPESASDTNQSAECLDKTYDSQDVTENIAENPSVNPELNDDSCSKTTTGDRQGLDVIAEAASSCKRENEGQLAVVEAPREQEIKEKTDAPTQDPDTVMIEASKQDEELPKVEPKDDTDQDKDSTEVVERTLNDKITDNLAGKVESLSPQHHQDDGTFSLSQTNVDPQMEKMIDNLVEHGHCQQFAETLQQQAEEVDREKEVENIQREISEASNSLMKSHESNRPTEMIVDQPAQKEEEEDAAEESIGEISSLRMDSLTEAQLIGQSIHHDEPNEDASEEGDGKHLEAQFSETVPNTQTNEPSSKATEDIRKDEELTRTAEKSKPEQQSVEPTRSTRKRRVTEEKEVKDNEKEDQVHSDERVDDRKSLPERPVRQARLKATKRPASPEPEPKEASEKRRKLKEPEVAQEKPLKQRLVIKVPLHSRSTAARKTIATSAPSVVVPELKKVSDTSFNDFECKKYRCEKCKYSTDRLNNIVHHKKSTCSFFQQRYAEEVTAQYNSWVKIVQSPKSSSKKSAR